MSLPTEHDALPDQVGMMAGGGGGLSGGVAVLDPEIYRDMRWCANCAGARVIIDVFEFDGGRMEACQGCGEEKVRYTRTNSEAA